MIYYTRRAVLFVPRCYNKGQVRLGLHCMDGKQKLRNVKSKVIRFNIVAELEFEPGFA